MCVRACTRARVFKKRYWKKIKEKNCCSPPTLSPNRTNGTPQPDGPQTPTGSSKSRPKSSGDPHRPGEKKPTAQVIWTDAAKNTPYRVVLDYVKQRLVATREYLEIILNRKDPYSGLYGKAGGREGGREGGRDVLFALHSIRTLIVCLTLSFFLSLSLSLSLSLCVCVCARVLVCPGISTPADESTYVPLLSWRELLKPLLECYKSLHSCGGGVIADGRLLDVIRSVYTFGLTVSRFHTHIHNIMCNIYIEREREREREREDAFVAFFSLSLSLPPCSFWDECRA